MVHVNNAVYLTYCESARIRYWTDVTGEPIGHGVEHPESLILAEARITYRAQVFHGEVVTVETRASRIGRSSFTLQHRLLAAPPDENAAAGRGQRIGPRPLRLRERGARTVVRRRTSPRSRRGRAGASATATIVGPADRRTARPRVQSMTRRKIATAFWPPNPNPLTATVSMRVRRAVSGV